MEILSIQSNAASTGRDVAITVAGAPTPGTGVPTGLTSNPVQPVKRPVDSEELKQATQKINKAVQSMGTDLQFLVDDDSHMPIVKVVDTATREVIRQIPTEEVVSIAKALDKLQGLIIRQKA